MKYPLTFLLDLRKTRMERCEQALAQARALVKRRHEELDARTREHKEYMEWCDAEEDRLFAVLFAKPAQHQKILDTRAEMLANRAREAEFLKRIDDARASLEAARADEANCLEALQIAIRNREKLESHKSLWTEGFKLLEQMAEDAVMEETAESAFLRNSTAESF
jgi:flagellar biosynthesis chaperone FliJ